MKIRNKLFHNPTLWRPTWTLSILWIGFALFVNACAGFQDSGASIPTMNSVATLSPTAVSAGNPTRPAPANPKAYIGIFKDNTVAVLDTGTNQVLSRIPVPNGPHGLVVTPDGRWVYVSSDGDSKVSVIDATTDKVVHTIEVGRTPHGLAITPDGQLVLAAVFGTSQVAFIDTASNQVMAQIPVPNPHNIAISPDGHTAYVAAQMPGSTALAILNLDNKTQVGSVPLAKTPRALNFSPDGKQLYFTLAGVDAVQVLNPASNQMMTQIPVGASPHHPLFTPDGQSALVVSQGPGELFILDPKTSSVSKTVMVGKMPHWIALDPKGTTAWVTNEGSNDVSVVDLATGMVIATIPVGNAPRKIVIQPRVPAAAQIQTGDQAGVFVTIKDFGFAAPTITLKAGQTITWKNDDSVAHTVTSDQGFWDSGNIDPGNSYHLTLDKPGTYGYHCSNHPFMKGMIVITS